MPPDPAAAAVRRTAPGRFASGLVALTAPGPAEMTVRSRTGRSLTASLVALGIGRRPRVWRMTTGECPLPVLTADHDELVPRFGWPIPDASVDEHRRTGAGGVPESRRARARTRRAVHVENEGGGDPLVVADVRGLRRGRGEPSYHHRGRPRGFAP